MSTLLIEPEVIPALPGCTIETYSTREEWLSARGLGASTSPSVLGVGYAESSPLTEWGRMTGRIPPMDDSLGLRIGRKLEPFILDNQAIERGG